MMMLLMIMMMLLMIMIASFNFFPVMPNMLLWLQMFLTAIFEITFLQYFIHQPTLFCMIFLCETGVCTYHLFVILTASSKGFLPSQTDGFPPGTLFSSHTNTNIITYKNDLYTAKWLLTYFVINVKLNQVLKGLVNDC